MTVATWRHLPIDKLAVEYTGDNAGEVIAFAGTRAWTVGAELIVRSAQGDFALPVGDFVVEGIEGELYPVPRSIFLASYEQVGPA